jgi:hypothetical protein
MGITTRSPVAKSDSASCGWLTSVSAEPKFSASSVSTLMSSVGEVPPSPVFAAMTHHSGSPGPIFSLCFRSMSLPTPRRTFR